MPSSLLNDLIMLRPHGRTGKSLPSAPRFGADQLEAIPSTDEAKRMIAAEINEISARERNDILESIHGVADVFREDHEAIYGLIEEMKECLNAMERECDQMGEAGEAYFRAYRIAMLQDPGYIMSKTFLLMFLRAVKYDPKAAAVKLVSHFTEKLALFDPALLTRDLDLTDMDDEDKEAMESGCICLPSYRDRIGRIIVIIQPHKRPRYLAARSLKRAYWCMVMSSLRDPLTQFCGIVCVIFHCGDDKYALMEQLKLLDGTEQFIPYRCHGAHYLMEQSECLAILPLVQYFMNHTCRTHFRPHVATMQEHYKRLGSFGIVLTNFKLPEPVERDMIRHTEVIQLRRLMAQHKQRIALKQAEMDYHMASKKKRSDDSSSSSHPADIESLDFTEVGKSEPVEIITDLTENDVLWGRGKSKDHVGNVRMQRIVEELRPEYSEADRGGKKKIVLRVIDRVEAAGGRFLRRADEVLTEGVPSGWVAQEKRLSREKIGRYFRN